MANSLEIYMFVHVRSCSLDAIARVIFSALRSAVQLRRARARTIETLLFLRSTLDGEAWEVMSLGDLRVLLKYALCLADKCALPSRMFSTARGPLERNSDAHKARREESAFRLGGRLPQHGIAHLVARVTSGQAEDCSFGLRVFRLLPIGRLER